MMTLLEEVGFVGICIDAVGDLWRQEGSARFRSMTFVARKPTTNATTQLLSLTYRGPWKRVEDDAGNVFERGLTHDADMGDLANLGFGEVETGLFASAGSSREGGSRIVSWPAKKERCC
jgi:hypothetical protein